MIELCLAAAVGVTAEAVRGCDFEGVPPYCALWTNSGGDSFDWSSAGSGFQHTSRTGPDGPQSGDRYLYLEGGTNEEATWHAPGAAAYLVTRSTMPVGSGGWISFWTSLHGEDVGFVALQGAVNGDAEKLFADADWVTLWNSSGGRDGPEWVRTVVDLTPFAGLDTALRFVGSVRGSGPRCDAALDSVSVALQKSPRVVLLWPNGTGVQDKHLRDMSAAVQAAADDFESEHDPPWAPQLVFSPPATDVNSVSTAMCDSLAVPGTVGFVGPATEGGGGARLSLRSVAQISAQHKIPVVSPTSVDPELNHRIFPFLRKVTPQLPHAAAAVIQTVRSLSYSGATLLFDSADSLANIFLAMFAAQASAAGVRVASVSPIPDATMTNTSYEKLMLQISDADVPVVVLAVFNLTRVGEVLTAALESPSRVWGQSRAWIVPALNLADVPIVDAATTRRLSGLLAVRPEKPRTVTGGSVSGLAKLQQVLGVDDPSHAARAAYDAAKALLYAVDKAGAHRKTHAGSEDCANSRVGHEWVHGDAVLRQLDEIEMETGATGVLRLKPEPARAEYEVLNLRSAGATVEWRVVGHYSPWRNGGEAEVSEAQIDWAGGRKPDPENPLQGQELRVLFVEGEPYVRRDHSGAGQHSGLVWELMEQLSEALNFSFVGAATFAATHSEALDQLRAKQVELVAGVVSITEERQRDFDFTQPYLDAHDQMIVGIPESKKTFWLFLRPFSWEIWISLGLLVGVTGALFFWMDRGLNDELTPSPTRRWLEAFLLAQYHSFLAFLTAGTGGAASHGGRLLMAGAIGMGVLLVATYTAELAAYLATASPKFAVKEFGEIVDGVVGLGRVIAEDGSTNEQRLLAAVGRPGYQVALSPAELLEAVRSKRAAVAIADSTYAKWAAGEPPCDLRQQGQPFNFFGIGFPLKHGSRYTRPLSRHITLLRENGALKALQQRYLTGSCGEVFFSHGEEALQLTYEGFGAAFMLYIGVLGAAVLLSLASRWWQRRELREEEWAAAEEGDTLTIPNGTIEKLTGAKLGTGTMWVDVTEAVDLYIQNCGIQRLVVSRESLLVDSLEVTWKADDRLRLVVYFHRLEGGNRAIVEALRDRVDGTQQKVLVGKSERESMKIGMRLRHDLVDVLQRLDSMEALMGGGRSPTGGMAFASQLLHRDKVPAAPGSPEQAAQRPLTAAPRPQSPKRRKSSLKSPKADVGNPLTVRSLKSAAATEAVVAVPPAAVTVVPPVTVPPPAATAPPTTSSPSSAPTVGFAALPDQPRGKPVPEGLAAT